MKIRLAKKIMSNRPEILYGMKLLKKYWGEKQMLYDCFDHKDHRITKAISLTNHWYARRYINELIKSNKKHPFKLSNVQCDAERLKQYNV